MDLGELREPVIEARSRVRFPSPLAVAQIVIDADDLVFPEPGEYRVQVLWGAELLLERRIVVLIGESEPPDDPTGDTLWPEVSMADSAPNSRIRLWCSEHVEILDLKFGRSPTRKATSARTNCRAMPFDKLKPYLADRPLRRWKEQ